MEGGGGVYLLRGRAGVFGEWVSGYVMRRRMSPETVSSDGLHRPQQFCWLSSRLIGVAHERPRFTNTVVSRQERFGQASMNGGIHL
jgi:hypothetical protein